MLHVVSNLGHCVNVEPEKVPVAARPTRYPGNQSQNLVSRRRRLDYQMGGCCKYPAAVTETEQRFKQSCR